jgi:hypothetical protein
MGDPDADGHEVRTGLPRDPGDDARTDGRHEALEHSPTRTSWIRPQAGAEQDPAAAGVLEAKVTAGAQHARSLRAGPAGFHGAGQSVIQPLEAAGDHGPARWPRPEQRRQTEGAAMRRRAGTPSHQRGNRAPAHAEQPDLGG